MNIQSSGKPGMTNFSWLRQMLAMLVFFLMGNIASAQHDVALEKSVDLDSVRAGDTVTWTIRLLNENHTNVAGLQVRDTLLPGLTYLGHSAPNGTTYNPSNGIWTVGQALNAGTNELALTIRTRVEDEGMYMNIAEVVAMDGTDVDSGPDNGELLEDDIDKACVSVPITICSQLNDTVMVTLLPMFSNIQWFKDGALIPAGQGGTRDTFYITQAGIYSFTATKNGCPTMACCPVVVKDSCYDLALRKTLAAGQNDTVNVGGLVQFTLEVINQGDLPTKLFSLVDYVDLDFFAPFSPTDNPPGSTSGDAAIPYVWSSLGNNGQVDLVGELAPGQSVQLPVTLRAAHGGNATNFAEIFSDDDRDLDSQPESQEQDGNGDNYSDNTINNMNGDEDDHDGATLAILAASIGQYVWDDADHDGQQDSTENGISGVIIHLYDADSMLVATATTDSNGYYVFTDLPPGTYYAQVDINSLPTGLIPTTPNVGNDDTDSDGGPSGWTGPISVGPGEVDNSTDFGLYYGNFDLALQKSLAPGQPAMVDIGDDVTYIIKITNEGNLPAYHVDVKDNIPVGTALSPNDPLWTLSATGEAVYSYTGPLLPGQSDSVEIILTILYGASGQQVINTAEITSAEDNNGTVYLDVDSTPNNGDPAEDDIDEQVVELIPHDPTGWIYCDKTGQLITGGTISVVGPNGIPNSQVTIVHDGSEGYYEFYTNGTPGIYTLSYTHPAGIPLSPNCPPQPGPFDPTGLGNPVVLGSDTLNSNYLVDTTCASNPYYLSFDLAPGDPIINHNNLPVQCIFLASIVCEDTNHNDMADTGDHPLAGATVNLYNCANPNTPIATTVTDSLGHYHFDIAAPGSYMVGYVLTPGIRPVSGGLIDPNGFSSCVNLTWGQCDTSLVICLYTCPDVNAGPDLVHCNSMVSSQLHASVPYGSGSFAWSPTTGLSNPNISNPIATPPATIHYVVTYDDAKGCVDTDTMTIIVGNPTPTLSYTPWADTTVECASPLLAPFQAPVFTDACDNNLVVTLDSTVTNLACGKTIVRTWTATNDNGNSISFTQTVHVVDTTPPMMFANHAIFGQLNHGDTLYATCAQIPSLDSIGFSAYDLCSATSVNFTETITQGNCAVDGFLQSRYCGWTATDACGNTDSLYFWIIVKDNVPPQLIGVPANMTLACGQPLPSPANVTATDNCGGTPAVTFSQTQTGNGCAATITRTWTATDDCGNSTSASQTIQMGNDNIPPVLVGVPANMTGTCGNIPPVPSNITATDNCDSQVDINFSQTTTGNACSFIITRTWTATDDCGNTTVGKQIITLQDNDAPVLVGLPAADITVSCGNVPPPPVVTATDSCDTNVTVTFTETPSGTGCTTGLLRTWTATDDCNHTTTFTQTIHVVDDQPPVITVIAPGMTWLSDGDTLVRQCNQVVTLTAGSAVATDACCATPPTVVFHEYVQAGNCQDDGYLQIMTCGWVATDCCGNVDSLFFTVIVTDTIPPKLYGVPNDLVLPCGQTTLPNVPTVVAQDNCSSNIPVVFTTSTTNIPGGYIVTRTWTATDACGNVTVKSQHITVMTVDIVPPVITNVPPDLSLSCSASVPPPPPASGAGSVTATDNCDPTPTLTFQETVSGSMGCQTIIRTWTATDDAGNSSTATQVITITDSVPPVLVGVPANMAVDCASLPIPPTVTATDNCDNSVTVTMTQAQSGSGCNYTLTRTWTAIDNCGNSSTAQQVITVNDLVPPVFVGNLPQNTTAQCGSLPTAPTLTATDNCDNNVAVTMTQTQSGTGCNYTLTRTWTATDDCGNTATHVQVISVSDNVPPVFVGNLPQNTTAQCGSLPTAPTLTATDNCDNNVAVTMTQAQSGSGCNFTVTRTWTATDDCGNTATHVQVISVSDNVPPVFVGNLPQSIIAQCGALPTAPTLTATDNCDNNVAVTMTQTQSGSGCNFTVTRTWTATDDCGNTATHVQVISVSDNVPPVFVGNLPQNMTVDCSALPAAPTLTATDNCDNNVTVTLVENHSNNACPIIYTRTWTATDDCGNTTTHTQVLTVTDTQPPVAVSPPDITVSCNNIPAPVTPVFSDCDTDLQIEYFELMGYTDSCYHTIKRVWQATDDCGNVGTAFHVITVVDDVAPQLVFIHPTLAGLTDGDTVVMECAHPDIFGAADAVAIDECNSATVSFVENGITMGNCTTDGFIVIMHCTWIATDACGNSTSVTLHMRVEDNEPPVFTNVPADITINCGQPMPPCGNPTVTDGCGAVNVTVAQNTTTTANGYDRTCYWTATDACGNVSYAQSTVHVVDNAGPIISGVPNDTTIYLAYGQTVPPVANVTATDGCPPHFIPVVFTQTTVPMGSDGCMDKIIRTWTATDDDGNTIVQQQVITVVGFNNASIASIAPDTCGMGVGSAVLAPAGYGFTWSNGMTGNAATGLSAGTYTVTATNGSCTKILTVVVGNVQTVPTITSINTTPESCNGHDGTATLEPASYNYVWSDGGTGATRTGLAAGSYNVTATVGTPGGGGCSLVFVVNVANGCDCVPAVLTSITKTDADCGLANGAATLNIAGNLADYNFFWLPTLGTPNASGNARTNLPSSHYIVLVTYHGNNNCVAKFELDIVNDCPKCAPVFPMDTMIVESTVAPANVCLPLPFLVAAQNQLELDGQTLEIGLNACGEEDVLAYDFNNLPNSKLNLAWELNGITRYSQASDLNEAAIMMNHLDPDGRWIVDQAKERLITANTTGTYGKMTLTHWPTGQVYAKNPQAAKVKMGTRVYLEDGPHQLVVNNASGACSDTLTVLVSILPMVVKNPSTLRNDTLVTKKGKLVTANVLANDQIQRKYNKLNIATQPANGQAWVNVDQTVTYRPLIDYCNTELEQLPDHFNYEVSFEDGSKMTATVFVEVACPESDAAGEILLYPNPASRLSYLDASAFAGKQMSIVMYNNLGVTVKKLDFPETPVEPIRLELDDLVPGHYAVWVKPENRLAFIFKLIVVKE